MYTFSQIVSLSDSFFFQNRKENEISTTLRGTSIGKKSRESPTQSQAVTARHDDLWWRQQHFVVFIYHSTVSRRSLVRRRQNGKNVLVAWENITAAYVFVSPFACHTLLAFPPPLFSASLASAFFLCALSTLLNASKAGGLAAFYILRRVDESELFVCCCLIHFRCGWYLLGRFFPSFSSCDIFTTYEKTFFKRNKK